MDQMLDPSLEQSQSSSQDDHETSSAQITIRADVDEEEDNDNVSGEESDNPSHATVAVPVNQVISSGGQQTSVYDPNAVNVQYQLKTENGQVTYRVVHVGELPEQQHSQHVVASSVLGTQTIINPFGGTTASTSGSNSDGPFYVMMAPTQELMTPTTAATRRKAPSTGGEGSRTARDEKRRATHNEVERRRRDKINNWIMKLAKVVPDCSQDHTKQGQAFSSQSKGGILAKACEYITDLASENNRLHEVVKENELLSNQLDAVRQQLMDIKNENRRLKSQLSRHGIATDDNS
jgi:upstream stimulatory factor